MIMKKLAILSLVALAVCGLVSCEIDFGFSLVSNVSEETSQIAEDAWAIYPDGITVVSSQSYSIAGLFARYSSSYLSGMSDADRANTQMGFEAFCKASVNDYPFANSDDELYWEIASVTYEYQGKTLPGSLIWCSYGYGHTPINPRYFIIDSHWTMTGAEEFPSGGTVPAIALSHMDAVYICPNQMAEGEAQPYLCEEITADRTVAMAKAAMGFFHNMGMAPLAVCEGYSIGYSQGGASALAVHRAIEQDANLTRAIGFRGTYSGAGPYDMNLTLEKWNENNNLSFPAALGLIALAWDEYYADRENGHSAVDYFLSQKYRDSGALDDIAARSAGIGSINNKISSAVGALTMENLLTADWDSDAYAFKAIATGNNLLAGWTPTHPIVFFHSTDDEVVPFANTQAAMEYFPASLTTLHKQIGDHSSVGVKFYSWLGLQKGFPMAKSE